ncbi:MAG: hypothetical protein DRO99_00805 [Candidatus Aenigmatarchaeota archaeon]|nr:MAG: hypothetical protein DRO99_00805 [Candidatus Aenigmarchaeota archaeon]
MRYAFPVLLVIFVIAFALGGLLNTNTIYVYEKPTMWGSQYVFEPYSSNITNPNMTSARVVVPAVDDNGVGVPTVLLVQVVPGSGKSLVNIDRLFFWVDTQNSIRTAMHVAENILGMNL